MILCRGTSVECESRMKTKSGKEASTQCQSHDRSYDVLVAPNSPFSPTSPSCFPDEKAEDNFHRQQVNRLMNMHSADTPWSRPGSNVIGQNYYNKYLSTAAYNQECISYQSSTSEVPYFSYMGTAASARDLVALADHLQGPGTPINFWGFSHGSLIGSYLVNSELYRLCTLSAVIHPPTP